MEKELEGLKKVEGLYYKTESGTIRLDIYDPELNLKYTYDPPKSELFKKPTIAIQTFWIYLDDDFIIRKIVPK